MSHVYLAALVILGLGLVFLWTDPRARSSQALAGSLIFSGLSIAANSWLFAEGTQDAAAGFSRWVATLDALAIWLAFAWARRLRHTLPQHTGMNTRFGDRLLTLGSISVGAYWLLSLSFPQQRADSFLNAFSVDRVTSDFWFFVFSLPLEFASLCALGAMLLLLRRPIDRAEKKRLLAMCVAMPIMLSGLVLPIAYAPFVTVIGALVLLVGATQYHVEQGRRSEFLGRFLSPSVAGLVRDQGLEAMRRETRTIAVLHCDIRGFTRRCQDLSSEEILDLLRQFYAHVGRCCEDYEATIKDYAGDGVMVLIGAPLAIADPGGRAMQLAEALHHECAPLLRAWSRPSSELGLAVGVATGPVTLGVIGALRLEYVAVGSTVNLAARLCEAAGASETLTDTAARQGLEPRTLTLKGFATDIAAYSTRAAV